MAFSVVAGKQQVQQGTSMLSLTPADATDVGCGEWVVPYAGSGEFNVRSMSALSRLTP